MPVLPGVVVKRDYLQSDHQSPDRRKGGSAVQTPSSGETDRTRFGLPRKKGTTGKFHFNVFASNGQVIAAAGPRSSPHQARHRYGKTIDGDMS